ncbi:MAG: M28 family peptidase [Cyclobacteriaceae bacterium]
MKKLLFGLLVTISFAATSQKKLVKTITAEVKKENYASHIHFLASDEMRGRMTGTQENEIAARYIAERFRSYGVKPAPGQNTYFQPVSLMKTQPPAKSTITVGDSVFTIWDDMIFISAKDMNVSAEMMYVGFGFEEDLEGKDVKGKILVAKSGNGDPSKGNYKFTFQKLAIAREKGAVALIELYRPSRIPWKLLINYLSGDQFSIDEGQEIEPFSSTWIVDPEGGSRLDYFKSMDGQMTTIYTKGSGNARVKVPNVVGYIEGTDPELKEEYIIISAHLDHVGVKPVAAGEDSIWNGARDNGIGISNMLNTAKYFAEHPPKRSIAFLACNAEEVGLLGSEWYSENPLIPLEKTVFNFNTDTGGYDDITKVTIVGFNRTSVTPHLIEGAKMFGLEAIDDMFPEENFYDRSDNVSFAAKGVPAISYGPGVVEMGDAINNYYHQPADESNTLDYDYLIKYSRAYIYTLSNIANSDEKIWWTAGDKYEEAGKKLYGK